MATATKAAENGTTPQQTVEIPPCTGTLGERICAVMTEIGAVTATGTNFARGTAISIEDVAAALRPLKAKHGVVIHFRCANAVDLGGGKNWRVDLVAHVENAANPEQFFEDTWTETGGNLSAAYSFGRKSYEKMLFEIATKEDDADNQQANASSRPPVRQTPQRPPSAADIADAARDSGRAATYGNSAPPEAAWVLGGICPLCNARIGGTRTDLKCATGHTPDSGDVSPDEVPF